MSTKYTYTKPRTTPIIAPALTALHRFAAWWWLRCSRDETLLLESGRISRNPPPGRRCAHIDNLQCRYDSKHRDFVRAIPCYCSVFTKRTLSILAGYQRQESAGRSGRRPWHSRHESMLTGVLVSTVIPTKTTNPHNNGGSSGAVCIPAGESMVLTHRDVKSRRRVDGDGRGGGARCVFRCGMG